MFSFELFIYVLMIIMILNLFVYQYHVIVFLIGLETLMFLTLSLVLLSSLLTYSSLFMFLVIMSLGAVEAAMGLSLLVNFLKLSSNDYFMSFSAI